MTGPEARETAQQATTLRGVILCGPPASGKSTVAAALNRAPLNRFDEASRVPIVRTTSLADARLLTAAADREWTCVLLWMKRSTCASRCRARGDADTVIADSLRVWDAMLAELTDGRGADLFHGLIHTEFASPEVAVEAVAKLRGDSRPTLMDSALMDEAMALCAASATAA